MVAPMFPRCSACAVIPVVAVALSSWMVLALAESPPIPQASEPLHAWQILDVKTGRAVEFDEWMGQLAAGEVIYLGEEHHNRSHIEAALKVLEALLQRNRQPFLTLEMFSWDGQVALDQYLVDPATPRDRFLQESHWEQNWPGSYDDYEPLILFAREHHLPVLAMNPPRPLVRRVARQGLTQALADPEMQRWGMTNQLLFDDPGYRKILTSQLRLCHPGGSDDVYQRMYEASLFRDEGMAKTITDALSRTRAGDPHGAGPVVSYTGGGHIQYNLPVPNRVLRREAGSVRQVTVYMLAYEPARTEEVHNLLQEGISDYVWLTPLSAHGPPRRCG